MKKKKKNSVERESCKSPGLEDIDGRCFDEVFMNTEKTGACGKGKACNT